MSKLNTRLQNQKGLTLVELLVALAIASIVMTIVYKTNQYQTKSYITQQGMVEMQQNVRAALHYMTKDIRMAGCDPTEKSNAGFTKADATEIEFTMDITGGETNGEDDDRDGNIDNGEYADGDTEDPGETVAYRLSGDQLLRDTDGDGVGGVLVAENIEALSFLYLDKNGDYLDAPVNLDDIRSVQISILAHVADSGYRLRSPNNTIYYNQNGVLMKAANDDFQRLHVSTEIHAVNLVIN